MTPLAVMRHAPTAWNRARRMQGRHDEPLDDTSRAALSRLAPPPEMAGWTLLSSPLSRAIETARLLIGREPEIDDRLIEGDWGDWEGQTHDALAATLGERFEIEAARGLDFQPPNGESPRQVQARLEPFLIERGAAGVPLLVVTHRGVMNALLSLATGWPLLGKPPARFTPETITLFHLDALGRPTLVRANIPLRER